MRSYRRILIGNGLANIPAKISTIGSSPTSSSIGNSCPDCQGDVGHKNYCKKCGNEPANADLRKALKIGKTERIPISDEHLEQLKEKESRIDVLGTIPKTELDGIVLGMTDNVYFIWEDEKSKVTKPLAILKHGIESTDSAIVVNSTISGKAKLGLIRSEEIQGKTVLVLQIIKYMEYANKIDEDYTAILSDKERELGVEYVEKQLKPIPLNTVADPYNKVIEAIMNGTPITVENKVAKEDDLSFFGGNKDD